MALGDSIVSICNIALIALGEAPITSTTEQSKKAILCNARYDSVRRAVLRAHPWNCARRQAQLAASPTAPPFGYANAYPLPSDFIRMVGLPENDGALWDIVGRQLLTDEGAPLNTDYIFDLADPALMDPLLIESIGYQLASELAVPLTKSEAKRTAMLNVMTAKLAAAKLASSQENSPREWDEDVLLRSRR